MSDENENQVIPEEPQSPEKTALEVTQEAQKHCNEISLKISPEEQKRLDEAAMEGGPPSSGNSQHPDMAPQLRKVPVAILAGVVILLLVGIYFNFAGRKQPQTASAAITELENKSAKASHPATPPKLEKSEQSSGIIPVTSPMTDGSVASAGSSTTTTMTETSTNTSQQGTDVQQQAQMQAEDHRFQLQQQRLQIQQMRQQEAYERYRQRAAYMQQVRSADSTVFSANPVQSGTPSASAVIPVSNEFNEDSPLKAQISKDVAKAYLPHTRVPAISPYEIKAGTVIPSVMLSGINSDLPGDILAQVVQNVYDSATGKYLIIPQGAKLVGTYEHDLVLGQNRVLISWQRIIYPDSSSVDIDTMSGQDPSGYSGFKDKANHHTWTSVKQALLLSAISAGAQLSQPRAQRGDYSYSAPQIGAAALGQQLNQLGMMSYQSRSNMQPTITIRPGYRFVVFVNKDMVLQPWQGTPVSRNIIKANL